MKAQLPYNLIRPTVIVIMVAAILLLMPFVPALAAPDQGNGYWTDSFSDMTGVSASTNISISSGDVRLDTIYISTIAFNDSFEENLSKWATTNWYITNTQYYDGSQSVMSRNGYEGVLRVLNTINLSDANTAYLDFWYRHSATEANDFYLQFYNGASWVTIINLGAGTHNTWLHYDNVSIDLGTYSISNFRFRFQSSPDDASEQIWIDQPTLVKTVKTTNQYCVSGNLNSTSITPANLSSWGTFNASDNTTCLPYRKPISITGTGTALTDYQINTSVSYVSGKMNSDFSDLRFKDSSGNILSYWIESYMASTSAQVWVKVPSIAASGTTTIYMYYGSATATSTSNGSNTFVFFDDFSGDLSKWNAHIVYGAVGINSSVGYPAPCLEVSGGTTSGNYGFTAIGTDASYSAFQDGIIEADIYPATNALPEIIFRGVNASNAGYKGRWDCRTGTETPWMMSPYNGWTGFGTAVTRFGLANQWQQTKLVINNSTFNIYNNGALQSTETDTTYTGTGEIGVANHYGSYILIDNMRVRKYASIDPTIKTGS